MESEDFQQYSQQNISDSTLGDFPGSQYSFNSSEFRPQTSIPQPHSFFHLDQFQNQYTPINLNYQRTFPANPMNTNFSSQQQCGPGFSFQGLMNAPNVITVDSVPNSSKTPNKRVRASKVPETSQSTTLIHWTVEEDVSLTKARLYVSGDADVGIGQKSEALWTRILQVWRENMDGRDATRDSNSLECRWSRIQPAVNKFHGFYEQMQRNPKSGTTLEDTKMAAYRMYREFNKNKSSKHEECWEICRKNPKWCSQQLTKQGTSKKQKSATDDSLVGPPSSAHTTPVSSNVPIDIDVDPSTPTAENRNLEEVQRPEGRKATKDKKKRIVVEKGVVDVLGNLQCTLEKQVEFNWKDFEYMEIELKKINEQRKAKTQKRKEHERILEKDPSKLDPDVRMTLKIFQAKIVKEWAEEDLVGDVSSSHDTGM